MRILYHFRVRGTGAEGVHIAGMAEGFRALGHAVSFLSPTGADPTAPEGCAPTAQARWLHGLADHVPQCAFECMELAYNLSARQRFRKSLAAECPDLIYERYAFFNGAGVWASKHVQRPLVLEVNEVSGVERVRGQRLVGLAQAMERQVFRQATVLVVVSDFLKARALEHGVSPDRILVVPNGVTPQWVAMHPPPAELDAVDRTWKLAGKAVVGFVGGLVHWHRFDFLLDVFAAARQTCPAAHLLLVGEGPWRRPILEWARQKGMADAVTLTGQIPHARVRTVVERFDVAVIPHSNEFRSPIKLFEYMGAGRALMAPDVPPIRAVVQSDADGILFPPDNLEAATQAMIRLLEQANLRRRLGAAAAQKVERYYVWPLHAARVLDQVQRLATCQGHSDHFRYTTGLCT